MKKILTGIERCMKLKQHKKLTALDKYVIYCLLFFTLYSIAEFIISTITGISHDALTEAIRTFCGGEVFACCILKVFKIRKAT